MINSDLPIRTKNEDMLNRSAFAESLAQTLLHYQTPSSFTIGLYGAWGSGKTSLLNMVLEAVEESNKNTVIIRFNPWLCSDSRQLITQYFCQLSAALRIKVPTSETLCKIISRYGELFSAASLIPGAGAVLEAAGKTLTNRARKRAAELDADLQGKKDAIIAELQKQQVRIIVSIDDIDRLSEEEIIAVFQLVKSLADFPNTVYLLAFDYEIVIHALSKVQCGDGRDYLEKIVQVPFEIPSPNMDSIFHILFSKLESTLSDVPEERWTDAEWAELWQNGFRPYIQTIRDVNRFTNVFDLKYSLLKDETDPIDLLGLTCLQVFEPSLFSRLPSYKDWICGGTGDGIYGGNEAENVRMKELVSRLFPNDGAKADSVAAKAILCVLFPRLQHYLQTNHIWGNSYNHRAFLIRNRIAVPACFDRYFGLMLEDSAIPTAVIRHLAFEADSEELERSIQRIYGENKIVRLLEMLEAYAKKSGSDSGIPEERAELLITSLSREWDTFEVEKSSILDIPFSWRLSLCVAAFMDAISSSERAGLFLALFNDPKIAPSTLSLLLYDLEAQHGRFTDSAESRREAYITLDVLLQLEQIFIHRALDCLHSEQWKARRNSLDFLWVFSQIDPETAVTEKRALVKDCDSLLRVISHCVSHGFISSGVDERTWDIDPEILSQYVDVDEAYQAMREFANGPKFFRLPDADQEDIAAFLIVKERAPGTDDFERTVRDREMRSFLRTLVKDSPDCPEQDAAPCG